MPQWQEYFNNPSGYILGIFTSIMSIGSIVAIPFVPYVADGLGRRWGIIIGCLIMLLGVILQGISINFKMFIAARFFLGFGIAIAHGASPLLITELVHPQHRATFTTIYNTTWYFGSFLAAWLCYGTSFIDNNWCWRTPSIVQGLPSLIQLAFIFFVPESPRRFQNLSILEVVLVLTCIFRLANCSRQDRAGTRSSCQGARQWRHER
jgi:MFS family permease